MVTAVTASGSADDHPAVSSCPDTEHTDEGKTARPASAASMRTSGPFKAHNSDYENRTCMR